MQRLTWRRSPMETPQHWGKELTDPCGDLGGVGMLKLNLEWTPRPSSMSCTMTGGVKPGDISPLMLPCCADVTGLQQRTPRVSLNSARNGVWKSDRNFTWICQSRSAAAFPVFCDTSWNFCKRQKERITKCISDTIRNSCPQACYTLEQKCSFVEVMKLCSAD